MAVGLTDLDVFDSDAELVVAPPFDVGASQESVTLDRVTSDTSRGPRGTDGMS